MGTLEQILLMRHAHATWAQPGVRDYQRPLDERGESDAALMGKAIADRSLEPDLILGSAAVRCAQTCEIVTRAMHSDPETRLIEALYDHDYRFYIDLLAEQGASSVMLIGHNPMMEDAARSLASSSEEAAGQRLKKGFPTAGVAIFNVSSEGNPIHGHLAQFLTPKRLKSGKTG